MLFKRHQYRDSWFDAEKIAQAERIAFNRWGYDRIVLGPNTRGIVGSSGWDIYLSEGWNPIHRESVYYGLWYLRPYGTGQCEKESQDTGVCAGGRYTEQRSRKSCAIRSKYRRTVYDCFGILKVWNICLGTAGRNQRRCTDFWKLSRRRR